MKKKEEGGERILKIYGGYYDFHRSPIGMRDLLPNLYSKRLQELLQVKRATWPKATTLPSWELLIAFCGVSTETACFIYLPILSFFPSLPEKLIQECSIIDLLHGNVHFRFYFLGNPTWKLFRIVTKKEDTWDFGTGLSTSPQEIKTPSLYCVKNRELLAQNSSTGFTCDTLR